MTGRAPDERVPGYLGRVLDGLGPIGTCFQVAPGVLATAWHVLEDLGAASDGARVRVDPLAGGAAFEAVVSRVDPLRDLAILTTHCQLPTVAGPLAASNEMPLRTHVTVTGHAVLEDRGCTYRFLTAVGQWAGGTTRDDAIPLGRIIADRVVPGMSGAPAIRDSDGAVVGVVSGRYNSSDGWPPSTAWVARTEDLAVLLDGIADVPVAPHPLSGDRRPPSIPQIPGWAVPRTEEMEEIITAVCAQPGAAVGITTGLEGAGGFGKTMLAEMACADPRVREHFGGRVYTVTIGRDARESAAIAMKVIEAIRFITGHTATYTDPGMAGDELGRLLDQTGQRALLVLDDVWVAEQLDPFLRGGMDCVRLVTTRRPDVLPDDAARVLVDKMTLAQARAVLVQNLPPLPETLTRDLITMTGQWALLLRLANRWMWRQMKTGANIATAGEHLLALLREEGPTATDPSRPPPDPADPIQRRKMVRATLQAATGLLAPDERQGLAELGIFAEDEPVPVLVAARLWQATSGLSEPRARDLCYELGSLSLLTVRPDDGGFLVLHDVIREYLRHELGSDRITALNGALTDAIRDDLPPAEPLTASAPGPQAAWWALAENPDGPAVDSYLAAHAIAHLLAAGRIEQAEAVACDIRWVEARLHQRGPAAPWSDCMRVPTPAAAGRARDLAQAAHLLAPTSPAYALTAVLHSRLGLLRGWTEQVTARQSQFTYPALRNYWPLPDLPSAALVRVLATRPHEHVTEVAIAPDGTWLATASDDGTVRIWNPVTGAQTATLIGHAGEVAKVAIAPDGSWLVTVSKDGSVRVWDPATGAQTATLTGHNDKVTAAAIAPDGTWLVTVSKDGSVRIWDPATGAQTANFALSEGGGGPAVAIAANSSWFATISHDTADVSHCMWMVCIWDPASGTQIASFTTGHAGSSSWIRVPAIAPDGTWLATASDDGTVRIWDPATGTQTATLIGHAGEVTAVAIAPDGTWLATASKDGTVRTWDAATGAQTATFTSYDVMDGVTIAPDGTWLATTCKSWYMTGVRIWDVATQTATLACSARVFGISFSKNSSRAAIAEANHVGRIRIWNPADGVETGILTDVGQVENLKIASDGSWLAAITRDGKVRIWDVATVIQGSTSTRYAPDLGAPLITKIGEFDRVRDEKEQVWDPPVGDPNEVTYYEGWVTEVAIAPDGSWLATADGDERARIWDVATGTQTATLTGHAGKVIAVAVAPDGSWLATADENRVGKVRIWDPAGTRIATIITSNDVAVAAVAIAPSGAWLTTVDDRARRVRIWAAATGTRIASFITGHAGEVTAVAIAPDGTWLATASKDGTVRIWDPATGAQTANLTGHAGEVTAVAIAPDGTWLATASKDGTVRIWDPATGAQTANLTGHAGEVTAVAIAPDSAWLATAGGDGTVRIWGKSSGQAVTMMRIDKTPFVCAWMPDGIGLLVGGVGGVYCYRFHSPISPA